MRWTLAKKYTYKPPHEVPAVVKNYLLNIMIDNKIDRVLICFSGGGDDGCVQDAEIFPDSIQDVGSDIVSIPKEVWESMDNIGQGICYNTWNNSGAREKATFAMKEIFAMVLGNWIYDAPVDWVNGEGGEGYCELIVKNNKLTIKISSHEWIQEAGPTHSCKL